MNIVVHRYCSELSSDWSSVIANAKNGVFLFERSFIEYHKEKFVDISAIAYLDDQAVAIMPATIEKKTGEVISHAGLTFGGIVLRRTLRSDAAISVIDAILDTLRTWGANRLTVKILPEIFANYPSSEVGFALWQRGFTLNRRDLSSVLPLNNRLPFNKSKKQSISKALKSGVTIDSANASDFYELLETVLLLQHDIKPTHTLNDIELLMNKFPAKIFIRAARFNGELIAGALIFRYDHIWHTQYLVSSEEGRKLGALDLTISEVINEAVDGNAKYLSFGISTEENGMLLNSGLLWQKESYGARSITHDFMTGTL